MNRITLDDPRDFLDWREGSGGTVEIYDIAVGSERGVGRGRRLVGRLVSLARGNTHLVFAIARVDNEIAAAFYEAVGFRVVARLPRFYAEGDAVMYGMDL